MADTTIGTSVAIATPDLEIIEGQITTSRGRLRKRKIKHGKQSSITLDL